VAREQQRDAELTDRERAVRFTAAAYGISETEAGLILDGANVAEILEHRQDNELRAQGIDVDEIRSHMGQARGVSSATPYVMQIRTSRTRMTTTVIRKPQRWPAPTRRRDAKRIHPSARRTPSARRARPQPVRDDPSPSPSPGSRPDGVARRLTADVVRLREIEGRAA
jgi:hypothetical protein